MFMLAVSLACREPVASWLLRWPSPRVVHAPSVCRTVTRPPQCWCETEQSTWRNHLRRTTSLNDPAEISGRTVAVAVTGCGCGMLVGRCVASG